MLFDITLGIGNQIVKNFINGDETTLGQLVSTGISSALGSKIGQMIPSEAFTHLNSPGPQFANQMRSLGEAIVDMIFGDSINKNIALRVLESTVRQYFVETFAGAAAGGFVSQIIDIAGAWVGNIVDSVKNYFPRIIICIAI